jgi:hypothetical protein
MLHGSVNILNNMSSQSKTEMTFCPDLDPRRPEMLQCNEIDEFCIVLDTSGSTNNTGGGRFGRRMDPIDDASAGACAIAIPVRTKPIYIAEMEGLSQMLAYLSNKFDLKGKHFKIASFDSNCKVAFNETLQSSDDLYDFACVVGSKLEKQFGSTNLTGAILETVSDFTKNTLLIILSDGRPDNAMTVIERMDYINSMFKKNNKKLYVFTVGAGSISNSVGGTPSSYSFRGFRNTGLKNETALKSLSSSGGECDKKFLEFISEKGFFGSYAGTYGDYSDLKKSFAQYLGYIQTFKQMKQKPWTVKLGGNLVELQKPVQQAIESLRLSGRDYALIFDEQRGYYIYSFGDGNEPYQMHVEPVEGYHSEIDYVPDENITVCFPENITINDKQHFLLYSTVSDVAKFKQVVFVAIHPDNSRTYFRPDVVIEGDNELYRVRPLE